MGKRFLFRSVCGHSVSMESDTKLNNLLIPQIRVFILVHESNLTLVKGKGLLGFKQILNNITKQIAQTKNNEMEGNTSEIHLIDTSIKCHDILLKSIALKNFSPNFLRSFQEACQYPRLRAAIDRELDGILSRDT